MRLSLFQKLAPNFGKVQTSPKKLFAENLSKHSPLHATKTKYFSEFAQIIEANKYRGHCLTSQ